MNRPAPLVVGAVLVREGRVLLCHRREDATWYAGTWDLVGGHVETNETPREALVRECREELGIRVETTDLQHLTVATLADATLHVYTVRTWSGEPTNTAPEEHQAIGWFTAESLATLALADPRLGPLLRTALH